MSVTFKNRGSGATGTTSLSVTPNNTTPPASGNRSILTVATKPETATIGTPTGWVPILNVTGGIGVAGADTGPSRIAMFYRDHAFSGAQLVTITGGNTSWGNIFTYQKTLGIWEAVASTSGDDVTGGSDAYSATSSSNPGWVAGDAIHAGCVIPTDAHTAFASFLIAATGISGGSVAEAAGIDSGTGDDIGGIVIDREGTTGTASSNWTLTCTFTGATNTYGPFIAVRLRDGPGLDTAEASHAHSADNVVLVASPAVQDATHAHTVDNVTLVASPLVDDAVHAHTADNVELTFADVTLVVADALHAHTADNVTVTHENAFRSPVIVVTQAAHAAAARRRRRSGRVFIEQGPPIPAGAVTLTVQDALHVHVAENVVVTQDHTLAVQDATQAHLADNVSLTQDHTLVVQEAFQAHTADNIPTLPVEGAENLIIADATHAHTVDNVDFTQLHLLVVDDATHAHFADAADVAPPTFVFTPPVSDGNPLGVRGQAGYALWRHYGSWAEGRTVWKDANGNWHDQLRPYQGGGTHRVFRNGVLVSETTEGGPLDLADAVVVYHGGHDYVIDQDEANELIAAGYGASVTP